MDAHADPLSGYNPFIDNNKRIETSTSFKACQFVAETHVWLILEYRVGGNLRTLLEQLTTNHSLQAELRERTEHNNQLWIGCKRQHYKALHYQDSIVLTKIFQPNIQAYFWPRFLKNNKNLVRLLGYCSSKRIVVISIVSETATKLYDGSSFYKVLLNPEAIIWCCLLLFAKIFKTKYQMFQLPYGCVIIVFIHFYFIVLSFQLLYIYFR
ncbi:hypothetical protein L1987_33597 [Smallanthus sonchifolius]|uniref:Uncharacterized protein n=1 Tax=Smallanthus sonchifolius TaxID=185202 RepID=A0ACB9HSX3_9ASTR|nr:hypothetical protein L1987_33597 [Smallanthus sonchifolius]